MSGGLRAWLAHLVAGSADRDLLPPAGRSAESVRRAEARVVRELGEVRGEIGRIDARVKALEVEAGIVGRDYSAPPRQVEGP
jgi:hypothetical protein